LLGLERRRSAGRRDDDDSATPVAVVSLPAVTEIAGGGFHTCAAGEDGAVLCWGSNDSGQLGDGTTTNRSMPMPVAGVQL
jgi:alpha-tubulin suppressor-like RCC1 family protein